MNETKYDAGTLLVMLSQCEDISRMLARRLDDMALGKMGTLKEDLNGLTTLAYALAKEIRAINSGLPGVVGPTGWDSGEPETGAPMQREGGGVKC